MSLSSIINVAALFKSLGRGLKRKGNTTKAIIAVVTGLALVMLHSPSGPDYKAAQDATVSVLASSGEGSGFVVKREGHVFVWTARHVIEDTTSLRIRKIFRAHDHKAGEATFKAHVIALSDEATDLALLWVEAPADLFAEVEFSSVDPLPVGAPVYHVGNFRGHTYFDGSVSTGVISQHGVKPESKTWFWHPLVQTTALIVPGSSGGAIFSSRDNRVVGVAVAWGGVGGISAFVPISTLEDFARDAGVLWAVRGSERPSVRELAARVLPLKPEPPPVDLLKLLFNSAPKPEPAPPAPPPKKALRRFTFKGW